jgi:general secretion pathway protein D
VAGFNVVFDPTYQPPRSGFNASLSPSDVYDALDYLAILTHTFWKPMNSNTIFVTDENVTKRRDYEDNVVRTFYVTNATSVQEFQEIANAVRTLTTIRSAFTYNAQKALVLRGTADEIRLAEKLIRDLDKPKAEVVVDVMIMTANASLTRDLAATILNAATGNAGLSVPFVFTPRNAISLGSSTPAAGDGGTPTPATGASTALTLANLGRISTGDYATTLPNAMLQATMSDSRTRVLDRPQVRSSDGMKVTLTIGDRIPYATGSFQPGVGTVGVSPLVSTQFNFIDTGTTIDITPQVHSAEELTLHVELNVNAVKEYINQGGLSQPVITQNKNTSDIRLRNGEVTILSGLSSNQDSSAVNGIPGLVNMPLLGKFLFGSNHTEKDRQELLIALIPHIVRTPDYSPENLRGVYAGVDQVVKVNYAHAEDAAAAPVPGDGAAVTPAPGAGLAAGPAAVTAPAPAPATAAGPAPVPSIGPAPPAAAGIAPGAPAVTPPAPAAVAGPAPGAPGTARISFSPATVRVGRNATFTVTVQADGFANVGSVMPLRIKFDPAQLRLTDVAAGDLLSRDGVRMSTVKDIRNDAGEATLTLTRVAGSAGANGSGPLATLTFMAIGAGNGSVLISEAGLKDPQSQPIAAATLGSVPVTVQ